MQSVLKNADKASGNNSGQAFGMSPYKLILLLVAAIAMTNLQFWLPWFIHTVVMLLTQTVDFDTANRDFANYWLSGRLVLSGDYLDMFVQKTHQIQLQTAFDMAGMETRNWSYPPHFLFITAPLGYFSYPAAYLIFMLVSLGMFAFAVAILTKQSNANTNMFFVLLLTPYVIHQLSAGQNGFLFAALMIFALTYRQTRPVIAGLALGALTMKPQLGLLFPLLLLLERNFQTIFWATIFTILFVGLSALVFGMESWHLFFTEVLTYQQSIARESTGRFLRMMPSLYASLRATGMEASTALMIHSVIALPVLAYVVYLFLKRPNTTQNGAVLCAATFVLLPYAFNYDTGALLVFAAIFLNQQISEPDIAGKNHALFTRVIFSALFALPLATPISKIPDDVALTTSKYLLLLPAVIMMTTFLRISRKSG